MRQGGPTDAGADAVGQDVVYLAQVSGRAASGVWIEDGVETVPQGHCESVR